MARIRANTSSKRTDAVSGASDAHHLPQLRDSLALRHPVPSGSGSGPLLGTSLVWHATAVCRPAHQGTAVTSLGTANVKRLIRHKPAFMLGVASQLVWPQLSVEIAVVAVRPPREAEGGQH